MIIYRDRWHYKLLLQWHSNNPRRIPDGFCPYVRHLIGALLLFIVAGAAGLVMAGSIIFYWYALFSGWTFSEDAWWMPFAAVGFGLSCAILLVGIWFGLFNLWHYLRRNKTEPVVKEDNIVVEYIKAKHEKICPRITFK